MGKPKRRTTPQQRRHRLLPEEEPRTWYVYCADHEVGPMTQAQAERNARVFNAEGKCSYNHVAREGSKLFEHLCVRHGWLADHGQPSHQHMVRRHDAFHEDDQGLGHERWDLTTKPDTRLEERTA